MKKSKAGSAVFVVSLVLIAIMAIWSVALNESFTKVSNAAFTFLTTDFGWLYLLAMMIFLVFVIYMALESMERFVLEGMTLNRNTVILRGLDFFLDVGWA